MVHNQFEAKVLDFMLKQTEAAADAAAFHNELKKDVEEIKINVKESCDRITSLETKRYVEIAIHDRQIKFLKGAFIVLGGLSGLAQFLHIMKVF